MLAVSALQEAIPDQLFMRDIGMRHTDGHKQLAWQQLIGQLEAVTGFHLRAS
jgi:hypothetical protein